MRKLKALQDMMLSGRAQMREASDMKQTLSVICVISRCNVVHGPVPLILAFQYPEFEARNNSVKVGCVYAGLTYFQLPQEDRWLFRFFFWWS